MTVVALLVLLLVVVDVVSAVADRGTRNHWFVRRYYFDFWQSFAGMELLGWRVRDVSFATYDGKLRLATRFSRLVCWLAILGLLLALAVFRAPWWLAAFPVTLLLIFGTVSTWTWGALKAWVLSDGNEDFAISRPGLVTLFAWVVLLCGAGSTYEAIKLNVVTHRMDVAVLYLAVGLVLLAAATRTIRNQRRRTSRERSSSLEGAAFFLRSFSDDSLRIRMLDLEVGMLGVFLGYRARFEECVAAFAPNGSEVLTIGRPGEELPELGAIRAYFSDDEWQGVFQSTAGRVRSIYAVAGFSSWLRWELRQLAEMGLLEKTLVFIPPVKTSELLGLLAHTFEALGVVAEGLDESNTLFLCLGLTLTGVGVSSSGRPVFYVSDGRDWVSYLGTQVLFDSYQAGELQPLKHGALATNMGYDIVLQEQ